MQAEPWLFDQLQKAAETVYAELGPGHTEAVYEGAMEVELGIVDIGPVRRQVPCTMRYKGCVVGSGTIDILVDEILVVEIKAIVGKLAVREQTQVKKYLASTGIDCGLLINFGSELEVWTISL